MNYPCRENIRLEFFMVWLLRLVYPLLLICVFLAGLAFLTANEDPVTLDFFFRDIPTTTGGSFVSGLILGLIVTLFSTWPIIAAYKFKLGRAQKRSLDLEEK
tara:strand:- start:575 stop:880 length:306 start_codon:yes stop_codon:yes gene_type:complete